MTDERLDRADLSAVLCGSGLGEAQKEGMMAQDGPVFAVVHCSAEALARRLEGLEFVISPDPLPPQLTWLPSVLSAISLREWPGEASAIVSLARAERDVAG